MGHQIEQTSYRNFGTTHASEPKSVSFSPKNLFFFEEKLFDKLTLSFGWIFLIF